MKRFENRVVIVTGAGKGIGRAYAECFAQEGAKVVLAEYDANTGSAAEKAIRDAGGDALFCRCDVSKEEDVQRTVKAAVDHYKRVDIVVNNAQGGMNVIGSVEDTSPEGMRKVWETGMFGAYLFTRECLPVMKKQNYGRFINVSSNAAVDGTPDFSAYNSGKEAIRGFTRTVAKEYARCGITANAICPFAFTDNARVLKEQHPDVYEKEISTVPVGRFGDPRNDIAPLVLFLASEEAGFVTGQTIGVDGGLTML